MPDTKWWQLDSTLKAFKNTQEARNWLKANPSGGIDAAAEAGKLNIASSLVCDAEKPGETVCRVIWRKGVFFKMEICDIKTGKVIKRYE